MNRQTLVSLAATLAASASFAVDVAFTTADNIATLQGVIESCSEGDRVLLDDGLYEPDYTIYLTNGVTLVGSGAANCVIRPTGSRRVIYMDGAASGLSNLTVTGGKLASAGIGVGIFMADGTIAGCIVSNNTVAASAIHGGGIGMFGGLVTNTVVTRNTGTSAGRDSHGTGVFMTNGVVACSSITENKAVSPHGSIYGSGMHVWGGTVTHCVVTGNSGASVGGGICIGRYGYNFLDNDVLIDRCLVANNTNRTNTSASWTTMGGGIGVFAQRGGANGETAIIRHTTIVGNEAPCAGGLGVVSFTTIGGIESCLVADNRQTVETDSAGKPNVFYSNAPSSAKKALIKNNLFGNGSAGWGADDITGDAAFKSLAKGDYHLSATSDAIDAGLVSANVTDDLDGYPVTDGKPDIGCYEFDLSREPFSCVLSCAASSHFEGATLFLSTTPVNAPEGVTLRYAWTVTDGGTNTLTTSGAESSVSILVAGAYTVSLEVYNDVSGDLLLSMAAEAPYVFYAETIHASPADDLPAIIEALADGQTLVLEAGNYLIGRTTTLSAGARIVGAGRDATVLEFTARNACLDVLHLRAVIEGVTIRGGYSTGGTTPVQVEYATIRDSRITACTMDGTASGVVSPLRILNNGLVERCILDHNTNTTSKGSCAWTYGRASAVEVCGGATLRNCLVHHNYSDNSCATIKVGSNHYGGGTVENCTVVDNLNDGATVEAVALMIANNGYVRNTIVARNSSPNWTSATTETSGDYSPVGSAPSWAVRDSGWTSLASYNCFGESPQTFGTACADGASVLFRDPAAGDWRIRVGSSCRDAGLLQPWMTSAAIDLGGNARVFHDAVDLGCYESQVLTRSLILVR